MSMLRFLIPVCLLCFITTVKAQYKNDNVLFKTVDPADLCDALGKNRGYILLDVRSKGEYNDTSASPTYNLGHLKGAINIDVRELGNRLSEIRAYTDKPVFVYCSHSQRSRRANKLLADSGFNKLFNINGGMTALYYTNAAKKSCLQSMIVSNNDYSIISAAELCGKITLNNGLLLLDVRSDSAFHHISLNAKENAYGTFNGSVNIPLADLESKIATLPKGKEVVITDLYGNDAANAAVILKKNGFKDVSVLVEGIDRMLITDGLLSDCINSNYKSPVTFQLINASEFGQFAASSNNYLLLDIRSPEEFANKHKDSWRNIGHLNNAISIPVNELDRRLDELKDYKKKEVVIYTFGTGAEIFNAALYLQKQGFEKIKVLMGGLFTLRWTAANTKNNGHLASLVTDVPEENR